MPSVVSIPPNISTAALDTTSVLVSPAGPGPSGGPDRAASASSDGPSAALITSCRLPLS